MRLFATYSLITLFGCLSGCDSVSTDTEPSVVVEAYLEAGASFGQVRLSRTIGIDQRYDSTSAAVRNADVQVRRLGDDGTVEEVIPYAERQTQPGVYRTLAGPIVQPFSTYELMATIPEAGGVVRARTIVPGSFDVIEAGPDTVEYQGPRQVEVLTTRSMYPGRQAILVFSTESLEPAIEALTPFYRDVVDDGDEDDLKDYLINESPPLNEDGYQIDESGHLRVKVPWLAFAFYGQNRLRMNAIDDNLFDFVRSQNVQQGGSTLAPGEIPDVIDHIEGGTGVFGSYARVAVSVTVLRSASD